MHVVRDAEKPESKPVDLGTTCAKLDGVVIPKALLDSGADTSLVSAGVIDELEAQGAYVRVARQRAPLDLEPLGGSMIRVARRAKFYELKLDTTAGPLTLKNLECWIHEEDRGLSLTIGRPVMVQLGYSTDGLLRAALAQADQPPILEGDGSEAASACPAMPGHGGLGSGRARWWRRSRRPGVYAGHEPKPSWCGRGCIATADGRGARPGSALCCGSPAGETAVAVWECFPAGIWE